MSRKNTILAVAAIILAFTALMGLRLLISATGSGVTVSVSRRASREALMTPGDGGNEEDTLLPGEKININTALQTELERLPGIGPELARRIIRRREEKGPFLAPEDLLEVPGIGEAIFTGAEDYITVQDGTQ